MLCANNRQFMRDRHLHTSARTRLVILAYVLGSFCQFEQMGRQHLPDFARKIIGQDALDQAIQPILTHLQRMGFRETTLRGVPCCICELLLANRSSRLEDLTLEVLAQVERQLMHASRPTKYLYTISRTLTHLGIIEHPLAPTFRWKPAQVDEQATRGIAPEWVGWCKRWRATTTLQQATKTRVYYQMLAAGRWLSQSHPQILSPDQWTRELAVEYVAMVNQMTVGQWASGITRGPAEKQGKPVLPATKDGFLSAARMFFRELQEWGWIPRRFDAGRSFATPSPIRKLLGPNPRVIADDIWAKLLTAGLDLQTSDFPVSISAKGGRRTSHYPLAMIRAVVVVWLFTGLRRGEIRRLRVGCIRWQTGAGETNDHSRSQTICFLDVPVNKTGTTFTKPVDHVVGEAIALWEQERPPQPAMLDPKTGELVHFLFVYRGKRLGIDFLNNTVIPALCRKSGVPEFDARGAITSHRARSTIASQLFNAKEPMSLFELQAWLGHRSPYSTQYYAKVTPTKLAQAYAEASYFKRNLRTIAVLIDREAITSGAAARGNPWRYFDLGHGYCSYAFFEQCPHRMACAKCPFYLPKDATRLLMKEAQGNLVRMKQEMELTDEEIAAVEEGMSLLDQLTEKLADIPTPAGPTPRQLRTPETR